MLTASPPVHLNGTSTNGTTPLQMDESPVAYTGTESKHIWIVFGPAGCGKSTIGLALKEHYGLTYIEGDEFHPKPNIEKMSKGIPLTDEDREGWLNLLRNQSIAALNQAAGVVLTCSALKVEYRNRLRLAAKANSLVQVHFVFLQADEETLIRRVGARQNHYMGPGMVKSQFAILEPPTPDETDVFVVDVSVAPAVVLQEARKVVDSVLSQQADSTIQAVPEMVR